MVLPSTDQRHFCASPHVQSASARNGVQVSVIEQLEGRELLAAQPTLKLINSATDKAVATMYNGMTIDMRSLGSRLNIQAVPDGAAGSIQFKIDGKTIKTESSAPYTIGGDTGPTSFNDWTPPAGTHKLEVLHWSKTGGTGTVVTTKAMTFTAVAETSPTSPPAAVPPATSGSTTGGVNINFQPSAAPTASSYLIDAGHTYGTRNGKVYGWSASHTDAVFDRNVNTNQLLDTNATVKTGGKWELAVPNGTYNVTVGVGDSKATSKNNLWVEGTQLYNYVSLNANTFLSRTAKVNVSDGRLTLSIGSSGGGVVKLNYIHVVSATTSPPPTSPPPTSPPPTSPPPTSPPPTSPPPTSPPPPVGGNDGDPTSPPPGTMKPGDPQAIVKVIGQSGVVGHPVVVNAVDSILPNTSLFANYQWDFGDPDGAYNRLPGWTAGHIYDEPGTYTVRLTLTDGNGNSDSYSTTIQVYDDSRRTVYVDAAAGNDNNPGTFDAPIRSWDRARSFASGNNVNVLFKRGQTFTSNNWMNINGSNVHLGAYGSGSNPVINIASNNVGILTGDNSNHVVIENLTFDTPFKPNGNTAGRTYIDAIVVGGTNIAIRNNTFLNVDSAANAEHNPTGFIFQDNESPLVTGVRNYMLWAQGTDLVVLGNYAANSTREHNLRAADTSRMLVAYNNFTNLSRANVDPQDGKKGTIQIQRGSWAYVYGNTVKDGPLRVGPRGEATEASSTRTSWVVVANNKINNYQLDVFPGATNLMIRDNVFNNNALAAIGINPSDPQGRPVSNVHILDNVGYNNATSGRFLRVEGGLKPDTITLGRNTYIAPKLAVGSNDTVNVSVAASNLSGFKAIFNNVWSLPASTSSYAQGGMMWVNGSFSGQYGFKTAAEWLAFPEVTGDIFKRN